MATQKAGCTSSGKGSMLPNDRTSFIFPGGLLSGPACWQYSRSALGAAHSHYSPVLKTVGVSGGMLRAATVMNNIHRDSLLTDLSVHQPGQLPAGVAQVDQCGLVWVRNSGHVLERAA